MRFELVLDWYQITVLTLSAWVIGGMLVYMVSRETKVRRLERALRDWRAGERVFLETTLQANKEGSLEHLVRRLELRYDLLLDDVDPLPDLRNSNPTLTSDVVDKLSAFRGRLTRVNVLAFTDLDSRENAALIPPGMTSSDVDDLQCRAAWFLGELKRYDLAINGVELVSSEGLHDPSLERLRANRRAIEQLRRYHRSGALFPTLFLLLPEVDAKESLNPGPATIQALDVRLEQLFAAILD